MSTNRILKNIIDHQKETLLAKEIKYSFNFNLFIIKIYQVISILQVERNLTIGGQKTVPSERIIANDCIYPCV
jgi:hypothetical protein